MADDNPKIIVDTDGVNEIEVGESKLFFVKVGKRIRIKAVVSKSSKPKGWVWIASEYLEEARTMGSGQIYDKWGPWKKGNAEKPIDKFGIGKQYSLGPEKSATFSGKEKNLLNGTIHYFEPFYDVPTLQKGCYVATIDTPKILSAYFARYKDEFKYPGESGTSNIYTYKNSIKLYVLGHMLPNYTVDYHNFALFEVDIYDKSTNKKITETPLRYFQKSNPNTFSVNTMTELDFVIDEKWRDASKHKEKTVKTYYAKIKTTLYSNEDASTEETISKEEKGYTINQHENPTNRNPLMKSTNRFESVAPNLETIAVTYTEEDEKVSNSLYYEILWMKFNAGRDVGHGKRHAAKYTEKDVGIYDTTEGTVLKNQQVSFQVKYNTMDVILETYEVKKNNMFAVVGDVEYSSRSNEPCKFSKIQIEHKSRKAPFVLFDEDKTTQKPIDHTNLAFGIVAGDKKEDITITAIGLAIQNYQDSGLDKPRCLGVTTAKKIRRGALVNKKEKHRNQEEFKHNGIEDVFNMQKAYVMFPEARRVSTSPNHETTGSESIDIGSQDLEYTHGNNSVTLKTGYLYNKTYDTSVEKIIGSKVGEWTNDLIDKAWILRYFLLRDNQAQTYFVPIGTCRYPNQMARIAVYPDINWAISFSFGDVDPKHKENWQKGLSEQKQKLIKEYKEDLKPFNRKAPLSNKEKKKEKALKKLKLSLGIKASYGTKTINLTPDLGKKINDFVYAFAEAKNLIDKVSGNGPSKEKQNNLHQRQVDKLSKDYGKKFGKKWLKKIAKAPITITVHQPSFTVGFAWGRKVLESQTNANVPIAYDIYLKAAPLFKMEGSLDLITCATFIPVAGQVIKVVEIVLNVVGVEPVLKLTAMGEIKASIIGTVKIDGDTNESKLERSIGAGLKMTIEASITVGGGLVGFMFAGGDIKGTMTETSYTAYAETGFELNLSTGATAHKGTYTAAKLEFLGLVAVGKKEIKRNEIGGSSEELFRYTIVEKTTFMDKTFYF